MTIPLKQLENVDVFTWVLSGNLATGIGLDCFRAARNDGFITGVIASAFQIGTGSSSIFDINKHVTTKPITTQSNAQAAVTIYTTQGNRPTIASAGGSPNGAIEVNNLPDIATFLSGDLFSLDCDQTATGGGPNAPSDFCISMYVQYT